MKKITLIDKAFLLKRSVLFQDLDLDLLLTIADKLNVLPYQKGDEVFPVGQPANRMYLIARGSVELKDGEGVNIAVLATADFFGDESLFSGQPRGYSATCDQDSVLLSLSRSHLQNILSECPSVAIGFLEVYTKAVACCGKEKRKGGVE